MRKCMALLMILALLMSGVAGAEGTYSLAGYDVASVGHDWPNNLFFQRMQEMTGIAFTYRQYTDAAKWQAAKDAFISGAEPMPDVLFKAALTPQETQALLDAGLIIDLRPLIESDMPNLWAMLQQNPQWLEDITLPDGRIGALPGINQLQNNNAIWINTNWLAALKMDMPTTPEEFTAVLRAFRDLDPNLNGKKDEIPMTFTGMWDLNFLAHAYGVVMNDYHVCVDADGKVITPVTTAEYRIFVEWMRLLWEERLIDHNGFSSADTTRAITDAEADITYGVVFGPSPMNMLPSAALNQYSMLPPFVYEGKQVYRDFAGDVIRGTFAVSASAKDPAALLRWADYLYTEEGCRLAQAGLEGVEYELHEDGTWAWIGSVETVANTVLAKSTIYEGGAMPGLSSVAFQLAYDDAQTQRVVQAQSELKQLCVLPYPLVYLSVTDNAWLNATQMELGFYIDKTVAGFIAGDYPLDDQTWGDFCKGVESRGMADVLALLQAAIDN